MGRAVRNAGIAVRLWEPHASASEDVCREPVLRLVKQCISQRKGVGYHLLYRSDILATCANNCSFKYVVCA